MGRCLPIFGAWAQIAIEGRPEHQTEMGDEKTYGAMDWNSSTHGF